MFEMHSNFEKIMDLRLLLYGCIFLLHQIGQVKAEDCDSNGDLRLADRVTVTENEGRVEICLGGEWGTICDIQWGASDAKVACRQLGLPFDYAEEIFGVGGGSGPIHYSGFRCSGSETRLDNCVVDQNASLFEYPNCNHHNDAGIRCTDVPCVENSIRIDVWVVKVCHNRHWGFVCESETSWNDKAAVLTCDTVGRATQNPRSLRTPLLYFDGPVILNYISCSGGESHLVNCSRAGYGNYTSTCTHISIAQCEVQESCQLSNSIRLTNSLSDWIGRLEMCANGVWGSVCDIGTMSSKVKFAVAKVVCRELNHAATGRLYTEMALRVHLTTVVPIKRTNLKCFGNESSLAECSFEGPDGDQYCTYENDIIVFCSARQCNETDVRLSNGSYGRVEICFDGLWGSVCNHKWDFRDAQVVCRQLEFDGPSFPLLSYPSYASNNIPIHLDDVHCNGTENYLSECSHRGVGINNCARGTMDAGVVCTNVTCEEGRVHLVGGDEVSRGRVEYCYQGSWYSVCANGWNDRGQETRAVCQGLGYSYGGVVVNYGRGSSPILPLTINCSIDDIHLSACHTTALDPSQCKHVAGVTCAAYCHQHGYTNCTGCGSREDCSVVSNLTTPRMAICNCYSNCYEYGDCCSDISQLKNCATVPECETGDVRLVGGDTNSTGRLEVCGNGLWGRVCNRYQYWGPDNARVVCRQLGYFDEGAYVVEDELAGIFGTSDKAAVVGEVHCIGTEPGWFECSHSRIGHHLCGLGSTPVPDIILSCLDETNTCEEGEVRLVDGFNVSNGRVEYCHHRTWGSICSEEWDDNDARVVCQQLGYNPNDAEAVEGFPTSTLKLVFLSEVKCSGKEAKLHQCKATENNVNEELECTTAGVTCSSLSDVARCVDSTTTNTASTTTSLSFGTCEVYRENAEVCSSVLRRGIDYVYISNRLGNQSSISGILKEKVASVKVILGTKHKKCLDALHFNHPASVCRDECIHVQNSCPNSWQAMKLAFQHLNHAISCDNPTLLLNPLPHCCTGAGIKLPSPTTSLHSTVVEPSSISTLLSSEVGVRNISGNQTGDIGNRRSGSGSGGIVAGSVIGTIIILLALIILAAIPTVLVYFKRKKNKRIEMVTLDIMPIPAGDSGEISQIHSITVCEEAMPREKQESLSETVTTTYPNPYCMPVSTQNQDSLGPSYGNRPRVPSHHVRHLTRGKFVVLNEDITLLECIGEGEFGIVYKARLKSGEGHTRTAAVKTLKGTFDQDEVDKFLEESMKMSRFKHGHVMGLVGVCLDAGPAPLIIMPFMSNGSLLKYLKSERDSLVMSEENDEDDIHEVRKRLIAMCSQIASGMEYLAVEKYIHRDLAARNCMIDMNFLIKITDFGLSEDVFERNYFRQGSHEEMVRLPVKWMAPESLSDGHFSEKSDVWSYGVTMWEIFSGGKAPYPGVDPLTLIKSLEDGHRMSSPTNTACNDEIYGMMTKCWEISPAQRPSFKDIHSNISKYIGHIGGYLDMGVNPFNSMVGEKLGDQPVEASSTV